VNLASLWCLDPSVTYLNHGSFGACPSAVLEAQASLRMEMEREPVDFLVTVLPSRLDGAREALAAFLGAAPEDLVFMPNATAGVNAVLRSLILGPGDELLLTNHTYAACRKTVDHVASRTGARVVVAQLPFPCRDDEEIVSSVIECVSPRTRLALLDHVTSPTALVLPIARLVNELLTRGVDTLVDGAHAAGMGDGGYSMRGYPLLPAFYMLCLLGVAARVFTLEPRLAVAGIVILATGWPLYRLGHRLFGGAPGP
jgi:isopenicillin-N epimerase